MVIHFKSIALSILATLAMQPANASDVYEIQYKGFKIWLDCDSKSAIQWKYQARRDMGNHERYQTFYKDPKLPSKCQQTSVSSYKNPKGKVQYDRGHLVPANAMDSNQLTIKQSNIMTNVLPQVAVMNRGAMLETELWVECRRDKEPITVIGGVYQGNMPHDGDFMISHGITAPEAFWKVAYANNTVIAWWIPNSTDAVAKNIDNYIVTPREIEKRINREIDVPIFLKKNRAPRTNAMTKGCQRS